MVDAMVLIFRKNIDCMHFSSYYHRYFLEPGCINTPQQPTYANRTQNIWKIPSQHRGIRRHVVWEAYKQAHYRCVSKPAKLISKSLFSC